MRSSYAQTGSRAAAALQGGAIGLVALSGLALGVVTLAGVLGYAPVLVLPVQIGETIHAGAGLWVQIALAVLLVAVALMLPSGRRVLALERSHRDFALTMSDVAEAYHMCHAADRADTFRMASEFDSVKERIGYLRGHPDLGNLEPQILEAAAQMSHVSRDLAETYSDENVARARGFLRHRREEIALFEQRFDRARALCEELRRHREMMEGEEEAMRERARDLEAEFGDVLDTLGFVRRKAPAKVVPLPKAAAE